MKRIFFNVALLIASIAWFGSCKDKEPAKELRPDCDIISLSLTGLQLTGVVSADDRTVTFSVPPTYDMESLKAVAPGTGLQISTSATVVPDIDVPQDFTKNVKYTVTAEDKVNSKEWTVKLNISPYVPQGIGQVNQKWFKTAVEVGLGVNMEATFATSGELVVCGRTGVIIDGLTGTPKEEKLNMEGIVATTNPANASQNIAFTLVNDEAGNLLGCTLGAWAIGSPDGPEPFRIYRWTSASADPVEIISYPQTSTSHFGRKLTAVGDVTKKAIVTSYDCTADNMNVTDGPANHTYWLINNGVAGAGLKQSTAYNSNNYQQMLWPVSENAIIPFYFSDSGSNDKLSKISYSDGGPSQKIPKGPVPDSDIAADDEWMIKGNEDFGYGRRVIYTQLFSFNGRRHMAILSTYNNETVEDAEYVNYYITVLDLNDNYKVVFFDTKKYNGTFTGINFNGTGGLAVSKITEEESGAKKMRLYAMFTGSGMVCYEISNQFKN